VRDKLFKFHKIETLFRRGGKRLHHFAANLFRKLCAKCYENRPRFIENVIENILVYFSGNIVWLGSMQLYCVSFICLYMHVFSILHVVPKNGTVFVRLNFI